MAVIAGRIESLEIGGATCLSAIRTNDAIVACFPAGSSVEQVQTACQPYIATVTKIGTNLIAHLPVDADLPALDPQPKLLAGKRVLMAIRNGETPNAALDWLNYHQQFHRAEAALIFDRDPPDDASFCADLDALKPDLPVMVASANFPLGKVGMPDARQPASTHDASALSDPWHAQTVEFALVEILRHLFLSHTAAFALLDLSDLLMPDPDRNVFDDALAHLGKLVPLQGVEAYPWRLRKSQPAPHGDHIAIRRNERRRIVSWATAPGALNTKHALHHGRPKSVPTAELAPFKFVSAMGVKFPGHSVNTLIQKRDLVEHPELLHLVITAFPDHKPLRLPQPAPIAPRTDTNNVTIVTAMKNEGPFILDWIAHNRAIGIKTHLVYTNDCEDGSDHLLDCLAGAGVTRRDNPYRQMGKVPQFAAFRAATEEDAVRQADWLLTLDVDEYINVHAGQGHITDLLNAAPDAHAFSMPWRMFGNNDIHAFSDVPVTQQFTSCAPEFAPRPLQAWAFKTIYRNAGLFRRLGVHRPKGIEPGIHNDFKWVDGSGRPFPPAIWKSCWRVSKANWGYGLVTLNHYAVRSAESFLVKSERGRVNHTTRDQGLTYWFRMNHNAEKDTSIQRLDEKMAKEKSALLALPGVADAHNKAVAWHRTRIKTLRQDATYRALYADITSERQERLSRMATNFGHNIHLAGPTVIPDEIVGRDPSEQFYFTVDLKRSKA